MLTKIFPWFITYIIIYLVNLIRISTYLNQSFGSIKGTHSRGNYSNLAKHIVSSLDKDWL